MTVEGQEPASEANPVGGEDHLVWPYWSVDLPGLTQTEAERIVRRAAEEGVSLGGTSVDPSEAFSSHIDHATAAALRVALKQSLLRDLLSPEDRPIAQGFAEVLGEWLDDTNSESP